MRPLLLLSLQTMSFIRSRLTQPRTYPSGDQPANGRRRSRNRSKYAIRGKGDKEGASPTQPVRGASRQQASDEHPHKHGRREQLCEP